MTAWNDNLLSNPHEVSDKRARVRKMFAAIAPSYDINNRLHSLLMDQRWRRHGVKFAQLKPDDKVVDVACGTGDLTIAFAQELERLSNGTSAEVVGIDFTYEMLQIARAKSRVKARFARSRTETTEPLYVNADAQTIPLPDQSADVVSIAFGIRNVQDPRTALKEFHRILRPGGRVIILEFSTPTSPLLRGLYQFYFSKVLPLTATIISRDKTGAYRYLPQSVSTFQSRHEMVTMMNEVGFENVEQYLMTAGICVCYRGVKVQ